MEDLVAVAAATMPHQHQQVAAAQVRKDMPVASAHLSIMTFLVVVVVGLVPLVAQHPALTRRQEMVATAFLVP